MSELPFQDPTATHPRSLGIIAAVILVVVFAPAAVACLFSLLHP